MKQSVLCATLLGLVFANSPEPNWVETEDLTMDWNTCSRDDECPDGYACVQGIWQNPEETGSY